jgi:peptidoglycan/LPS O-acetylase OafA/YrhL
MELNKRFFRIFLWVIGIGILVSFIYSLFKDPGVLLDIEIIFFVIFYVILFLYELMDDYQVVLLRRILIMNLLVMWIVVFIKSIPPNINIIVYYTFPLFVSIILIGSLIRNWRKKDVKHCEIQ